MVATLQVSMDWIRHTTLTWVERHLGFATAQAYADHEDHSAPSTALGSRGYGAGRPICEEARRFPGH